MRDPIVVAAPIVVGTLLIIVSGNNIHDVSLAHELQWPGRFEAQ